MNERPVLPSHYARLTVSDIAQGEVYYPKQNILEMDDTTKEVFIHKYTELNESAKRPKKLIGRVGIMRILSLTNDSQLLDGVIVDARHARSNNIRTELYYPFDSTDEAQKFDCDELRSDCIQPLAIVALDEDSKPIYSGNEALIDHVNELTQKTDELYAQILQELK
jgi:hypothetical protein